MTVNIIDLRSQRQDGFLLSFMILPSHNKNYINIGMCSLSTYLHTHTCKGHNIRWLWLYEWTAYVRPQLFLVFVWYPVHVWVTTGCTVLWKSFFNLEIIEYFKSEILKQQAKDQVLTTVGSDFLIKTEQPYLLCCRAKPFPELLSVGFENKNIRLHCC